MHEMESISWTWWLYEGVLGLRQLNPYQMMAADVSGTLGGISTLDLVILKDMVDGVTNTWPATVPVWRFLDKNHQIINGNISPINTSPSIPIT
jgi:hypothetical protein